MNPNSNQINDPGNKTILTAKWQILLTGLVLLLLAAIYFATQQDGQNKKSKRTIDQLVVQTDKGLVLSEAQVKKMDQEIEGLTNAEQYALKASKDGYYLCGTCISQYGKEKIYLNAGEIWRYGVSTNGDKRYTKNFYQDNHVYYVTEFEGNYYECLVEEKKKIYQYILLPENLQREVPLIRPPMNLKTN